jgi:hypothetical protein
MSEYGGPFLLRGLYLGKWATPPLILEVVVFVVLVGRVLVQGGEIGLVHGLVVGLGLGRTWGHQASYFFG